MKNQIKTQEKKKIEELKLLLKEKEQEVNILKQKSGFFSRKCAELSEKLEEKSKLRISLSRKQARKHA